MKSFTDTFSNLEITHVPERPGDVKHTLAEIHKATQDFGYTPQFDFKEGLKETFEWWELGDSNG